MKDKFKKLWEDVLDEQEAIEEAIDSYAPLNFFNRYIME